MCSLVKELILIWQDIPPAQNTRIPITHTKITIGLIGANPKKDPLKYIKINTIKLFNAIPRLDKKVDRLETIAGSVPDPSKPIRGCSFQPRCDFSMKICNEQKPPPFSLKPGHMVKCWLFKRK